MQKLLFTLLLVLQLFSSVSAQQFPYQFSYASAPYVALTNAIQLDNNTVFDFGAEVPLGFDFQFSGETHNQMILDGYTGALFTESFFTSSDTTDGIFAYATSIGLLAKSGTKAQYLTEGTAPNRIFKVEILKAGFDGLAGEVSFQIWLYETSNAIQIRLGDQTIPNPQQTFFNKKSPLIGYMLDYHYISEFESVFPQAQFVVGNPAAPADSIVINDLLDESTDDGPQYGLTSIPLPNSVFTFTPGAVSTKQPLLSGFKILPNPARDYVRLEGMEGTDAAQVQILNEQGQLIATLKLPAGEQVLTLPADLYPGLYLLRYSSGGKVGIAKLLKV